MSAGAQPSLANRFHDSSTQPHDSAPTIRDGRFLRVRWSISFGEVNLDSTIAYEVAF